ncbi:MFS general substrate transporter [Aspergillus affinis]|uniref:MFS general substrate transporter n=1 Tax=Aspergillus affinis TaxID=1070780 RepID=UPI0022FDF89D|nr:MFS general substrate transporter [Aspergillus affinis]KAI9040585.1 MFS general substrate transporter [Aspergillus affinis]
MSKVAEHLIHAGGRSSDAARWQCVDVNARGSGGSAGKSTAKNRVDCGCFGQPICAASLCDVSVEILVHKTGRYREVIWAGTALLTLGTGLFVMLDIDTSLVKIIVFEVIGGLGLSMLLSTPMLALQNNVNQVDVAVATSTLGFIRNISISLSIVLGGVVFQGSMATQKSSLVASGLNQTYLDAFSDYDAAANVEMIPTIDDPVQHHAVQSAFAWSIRNMFIMYTAAAGIGLLASPFVKHRFMSAEHTETKTGIENMTTIRSSPKNDRRIRCYRSFC